MAGTAAVSGPYGTTMLTNPVRSRDNITGGGARQPPNRNTTAQQQAAALSTPVTTTTPVDPRLQETYNSARDYNQNLAAGTNEEITRELQRARDQLSVGLEGERQGAMSRGADTGLFVNRAAEAGQRSINALQGELADKALARREGALRLQGDIAGNTAAEQRQMHLGTMAQRTADDRVGLEAQDMQARLNEAPYQRLLEMLRTAGGLSGGLSGVGMGAPLGGGGGAGGVMGGSHFLGGSGGGGSNPGGYGRIMLGSGHV